MMSRLLVLQIFTFCYGYDMQCPDQTQRSTRANAICLDPLKYSCLDDSSKLYYENNKTIRGYSENCTRFDKEGVGRKIVIKGNFDGIDCDENRYQPIPFLTNVSHESLFRKSECAEKGQVVVNDSSTAKDVSCRCDYTKGYVFLSRPAHPCFCIPSKEDCSCYLKKCNYNEKLSPDYQCANVSNKENRFKCSKVNKRVIPDIKDKPPVKNVYQNNSSELVDSRTYVVYVIVCGESRYLDEETKETYLHDIRSGEERHRHIRVAIIGEKGVGKTCLLRRLLKQSIDGVQSTDGVNIEISKCKIRLRDGQWESYKAKEHESVHADRLKRALAKLKGLEQNLTTNGCDFDADGDESDNQSDSSISGERLSDRDSIVVSSDQKTGEIISETILSVSEQVGHSPVNVSLKNGNGNKKSVNFEEQQTDIKKQMKKEIDTDRVMKSKDRLLHQTHKQLISNDDKVEYVDCDLWDFAGEKEYYATHQAFISSSCIFLLVADISRDIMNFKQDPWSKSGFDSIEASNIIILVLFYIFFSISVPRLPFQH